MKNSYLQSTVWAQVLTLFIGGMISASLWAEDLYGGIGRGSATNPGAIMIVDQNNGAGVLVGDPVTPGGLSGLTFDSANRLWGSTVNQGPSNLVEINPLTGALISSAPILDNGSPISISDLATQPGTGIIFGITGNSGGGGGGLLYTIDTSGAATFVGNTLQGRGGGLAFAPDGTLYYAEFNQLHSLNPATGTSNGFVSITGGATDGLGIRPSDGVFFATQAGNSSQIYTLDPNTGIITTLGSNGIGAGSDLAFTQAVFDKEITDGNDYDEAGGIDLAVEVGIEDQSHYDFKINYNQPGLPPVQIEDTVPAEWQVVGTVDDSLNCEVEGANKKNNGKSATKLVCLPEGTEGMVTVQVDARCHDSRNNKKCRPTSCGALYLNNGAAAYELDPDTGEPVLDDEGNRLPPLLETNALCLVAVSDLNGGGIDYSGNGDEDGDGLLDHDEACSVGTDPCVGDSDGDGASDFDEVASGCMDPLNPDTDGDTISDGDELAAGTDPCNADSDDDGYDDNVDSCPLEGPADPAAGEILMTDGCLRQSQCSDGLDNEPDGNTDFPADASCDDILDDSEDTVDPAAGNVTFQNGYYWVRAEYAAPQGDHGAVCASAGLVATTTAVALTWDATLLETLSTDFGYLSNGDDGCCAESMWCWDGDGGPNTPAGSCETHNFTTQYFNYGEYSGDPDVRPVFTCSDP